MKPQNLLLIMTDGHDPRYMGASGHPLVRTPGIDRLAERGTRFTNAYTPCPLCVPARASFATGRHVHETGYWDNAFAYDGRVRGWAHLLQQAGRRIESIGKLHYRHQDDPLGFDRQHEPMHIADGTGMVWGVIRDPFPELTPPFRSIRKVGPGVSNYNLYDRRIANMACEWLSARARETEGGPWMLYVGFVAPHFPLVVPRKYLDLYPVADIPLPKRYPDPRTGHHPWVEAQDAFIGQDKFFDSNEARLRAIAAYFGLLSFIDTQVGLVLDALAELGLDRETRVIYTSDHGDSIGARGLWGKSVFYEESVNIPMILAGPDVPAGEVCNTPVNLTDCYATILDGLGVEAKDNKAERDSRSLFGLAAIPNDADRPILSQYHAFGSPSAGYMLRKGRYKYHHYVGYPPELFDLEADPEELDDLAVDPGHSDVLEEYEALLRAWLDPDAVDRRAKADQEALIERHGGREKAKLVGAPGATPVPGYGHE